MFNINSYHFNNKLYSQFGLALVATFSPFSVEWLCKLLSRREKSKITCEIDVIRSPSQCMETVAESGLKTRGAWKKKFRTCKKKKKIAVQNLLKEHPKS